MTSYRLTAPVIRWGTNLANAIYFPFPADSVFSGDEPRPGSEFPQAPSGVEAAWYLGTDYVWSGTLRWLQQTDTVGPYARCTGWDGSIGIRAALNYLRQKNTFSWHPDGRNLVRFPKLALSTDAIGGTAGSTTTIYNKWVGAINGTPTAPTVAFDAGNTAWKLTASGATGSSDVDLRQRFPVIPGESLCISADYLVSGLTGGANAILAILIWDVTGTSLLQTHAIVSGLTSTSFVRATTGFGGTVTPAGSAFAEAIVRLTLPNAATGNADFRNVLVRRDTTDTTFVDNPSVDGCYIVDPMTYAPANEGDGTRQLALKIRNSSTEFSGY